MSQSGKVSFPMPAQPKFDPLTGLGSRRRFEEQLVGVWKASESCGTPFSLLLVDIDCFKDYNTEYGKEAGDDCLRQVAAALKSSLRESADFLARCGGEEFAAILPVTDETIAAEIAERLRQAVMNLALPHVRSSVSQVVTVSVGVTTTIPDRADTTPATIFESVDTLLYQAKLSGRNRITTTADYQPQASLHSLAA